MQLFPFTSRSSPAIILIPILFLLLGACDRDSAPPQPQTPAPATDVVSMPPPGAVTDDPAAAAPDEVAATPVPPAAAEEPARQAINPEFSVGNSQYVFDASNHTREELLALLKRADEVATVSAKDFEELEIALVLHGSDIDWFAKRNYEKNKELVDLAAKLDALEIIDLKICQQSMQDLGYLDEDIPTFIDRVPYAPDELHRLEGSGYFQL